MAHLHLNFLGKPDVRHAGKALTFRTRKTLALLVYLVVEGGLHSREFITVLLWPDSDAKSARSNLRTTLLYLRKSLAHAGDDVHLVVTRNELSFDFSSEHTLDMRVLSSAEHNADSAAFLETLALYRADFLAGFNLEDAPEFDNWAAVQREHWHLQFSKLLERQSQLQMESGAASGALAAALRWVAHDALDEGAHRRVMQLHFAARDNVAALKAYEKCRDLLSAELQVEPTPAMQALAVRIRSEAAPQVQPKIAPSTARSAVLTIPLVGRGSEHQQLVSGFHAARKGVAQIVMLCGEAGIGKTRLAGEFLRWAAAQGADVLHGRAYETGGRLPYQPIVEALRARLERDSEAVTALSSVWLAELSRLLPELYDLVPGLPVPTQDDTLGRSRLFESISRLGEALAERAPLVLFVDDIQWADTASLDVLHYSARRWGESGAAVLLLLGFRAEALQFTRGTSSVLKSGCAILSGSWHLLGPTCTHCRATM